MMLSRARCFWGDIIERTNLLSWRSGDREIIVPIARVAQHAGVNNYHHLRKLVADPVIGIKDEDLQLSFCLRLN